MLVLNSTPSPMTPIGVAWPSLSMLTSCKPRGQSYMEMGSCVNKKARKPRRLEARVIGYVNAAFSSKELFVHAVTQR